MDWQNINQNWALYAAAVPALIVTAAVIFGLWRRSSRGKLRAELAAHGRDVKNLEAAKKKQSTADRRVRRLEQRAGKVKPRVLQEARDAAMDASTLVRIADDRMQVSANLLRKVIFEEFPPEMHQRLREKYLPGDVADGRPFSF